MPIKVRAARADTMKPSPEARQPAAQGRQLRRETDIERLPARIRACVLACLLLGASFAAQGQQGWQWELAADFAFPTGKLGPAKLNSGPGFDATIAYGFSPRLGAYFGWNWHRFRTDDTLSGSRLDANESGIVLGMQWRDRFAQTGLDYRLRAGVLVNQIELEDSVGVQPGNRHGLGWELGAALLVPLRGHWVLTPGVRYRSLSADIGVGGQARAVDLRYLSIGTGVSVRF